MARKVMAAWFTRAEMQQPNEGVVFEPLGDAAVLLRFTSEAAACEFACRVRANFHDLPGVMDAVAAYRAVAVYFNSLETRYAKVVTALQDLDQVSLASRSPIRHHVIPCCYQLGQDFDRVHRHTGLDVDAVVAAHQAETYTVHAIGFSPGFPYLGYLPERLAGVPRLDAPRPRVAAGSVAIAGRQTGIYPSVTPGGWNLIGRTPLTLVDVAAAYFPIRTGDTVQFEPISHAEFDRRLGERLASESSPT
jgi:inhibitor of KinA